MFIAIKCIASKSAIVMTTINVVRLGIYCEINSFIFFFYLRLSTHCSAMFVLLVTRYSFVVEMVVRWYGKIMQNNIGNDIMISFIIIINISNKFKCTHAPHSFLLRVFFFSFHFISSKAISYNIFSNLSVFFFAFAVAQKYILFTLICIYLPMF